MDELGIKIKILADNLKEKLELLVLVLNITENQNMLLNSPNPDEDIKMFFSEMTKEKQSLIDQIVDMDAVFQGIFDGLGQEFEEKAGNYRDEILFMQEQIKEVMEMDVKIRAMEQKNRQLADQRGHTQSGGRAKAFNKNVLKEYQKNTKKQE